MAEAKGKGTGKSQEEREHGTVLRWNCTIGSGFIQTASGDDIYFHLAGLADTSVRKGDKVTYTRGYSDRSGKYQAQNVCRAGSVCGMVLKWECGKPFGFIKPSDAGLPLPCHISSTNAGVKCGDLVTFVRTNSGELGVQATHVRLAGHQNGLMSRWFADKGFGFITPSDGSNDLFCHISGLADGEDSVREGDHVVYFKEFGDQGETYRVVKVRRTGSKNGMISSWDAKKGSGFIQPRDDNELIFCHVSALDDDEYVDAVRPGDPVTYMRRFSRSCSRKYFAAGVRFTPSVEEEGRGTLHSWNSASDSGLIRGSDGGGCELYCHYSGLEDAVQEGDDVIYTAEFNWQVGRYQAVKVRLDTDRRAGPRHEAKDMMLRATRVSYAMRALWASVSEGAADTALRWDWRKKFGFVPRNKEASDIIFNVSSLLENEDSKRLDSKPRPSVTFNPEELPSTLPGYSGEQLPVGFQGKIGESWMYMGRGGTPWRWQLADCNEVPEATKQWVRRALKEYADEHGIVLEGRGTVKLAVQLGSFWISYAGGISYLGGSCQNRSSFDRHRNLLKGYAAIRDSHRTKLLTWPGNTTAPSRLPRRFRAPPMLPAPRR
eukprot:gnl/TRDRNA2_/TRDRNA2_126953_c0_seq1.p1 gnl/TRDRNA2_/TRDRNA2_126953_c0~~gnl/TRDRNA2_/TRDRNA2_126953_c0_seq1.p1  ORF type:complete len:652 (+),score=92.27 gnl/TRDRNA2_/TRDRNA2_126953_c0_seq1:151-1956(+)